MTLAEFWMWVEMQPLSQYIGGTAWFPFLESLHVLCVTFVVGDARALPFGDGEFDAAVSGLVLNFVPEPHRAVADLQAGGGR